MSIASMSDINMDSSHFSRTSISSMADIIPPLSRRILLLAIGSMGDVLPFINLGMGFLHRGHDVVIAANSRFRELIEKRGLGFRDISWDMIHDWQHSDVGKRMVRYSSSAFLGTPFVTSFLKQGFQKTYSDAERIFEGIDFAVLGTGSIYMYSECQARKIPVAYMMFYPYASSKNYTGAIYGRSFDSLQWLPFGLNSRIWKTVDIFATFCSDYLLLPLYNKRCEELGLSTVDRLPWLPGGALEAEQIPVLHVSNKHLISIPQNPKNPMEVQFDYPFQNIQEELKDFEPPLELVDFLCEGRKPIYFGYGSMHSFGESENRIQLWVETMNRLPENQRALFSGVPNVKNAELNKLIQSGRVFLVGHIPHSWLFPQVACVVHHGGAGTTHAIARAGVPSVAVPHFADQPWWASILHRHGLTVDAIPANSITADKLYHALLHVLTDKKLMERATAMGEKIMEDHKRDPVTKIVKFIENYWDKMNWDILSLEDDTTTSCASSESLAL